MQIDNLTNPGVDPVDGDLVLVTHDNGATEQKTWYAPVAPVLTLDESSPLDAATIVVDRMTAAEVGAAMAAPQLAPFIFKLQIAAAHQRQVLRTNLDVVAGFAAMVQLGVITQDRSDAILGA